MRCFCWASLFWALRWGYFLGQSMRTPLFLCCHRIGSKLSSGRCRGTFRFPFQTCDTIWQQVWHLFSSGPKLYSTATGVVFLYLCWTLTSKSSWFPWNSAENRELGLYWKWLPRWYHSKNEPRGCLSWIWYPVRWSTIMTPVFKPPLYSTVYLTESTDLAWIMPKNNIKHPF